MVATRNGGIATCDIPVSDNLEQFDRDYRTLTGQVRESGESYELGEDYMVIGTSALAGYEIDGAVNIYAGCYNNPFLIWGLSLIHIFVQKASKIVFSDYWFNWWTWCICEEICKKAECPISGHSAFSIAW